jgi:hypothetical protein
LWERSVSIGLGYHMRKKGNLIALGLGWGLHHMDGGRFF